MCQRAEENAEEKFVAFHKFLRTVSRPEANKTEADFNEAMFEY